VSDGKVAKGRRLFFALWPHAQTRSNIVAQTADFVRHSNGRAIPEANLHVTVNFLGSIAEARLPEIKAAGAQVSRVPKFEMSFDRIESVRRSRILWMVATAPAALLDLVRRLQNKALSQQPQPQREEFIAHVTLARDVQRLTRAMNIEPINWLADELVLVESQVTAHGSQYSIVDRWQLE
jgi:RNA 2',3'-cyclic 3'-phosphodiesterase